MNKQEIEQASKGWADNFDSSVPNFAKIKQQTAEISYRKGAEMVNSKQPYTAEDVEKLILWAFKKVHTDKLRRFGEKWLYWDKLKHRFYIKTDQELLKLWEESKNG